VIVPCEKRPLDDALQRPAISVVLPTRNGARYLDQAIESIALQTFADWELIVVDDASSDDTPSKIEAWCSRDDRIRALRLDENRKLPGALNEGFRRAAGEYFTWTSDDNWYAADAFARMWEILHSRPEVDVVYAACWEVDAAGTPIGELRAHAAEEIAAINCVGACFLYRRDVDQALGGYREDLFLAEDYDFWLRAFLEFRLEPLDEILYFYRRHDQSLTERQARAVSLANERAVEDWLGAGDRLDRRLRGRALQALGLRALIRGDVGTGRKHLLRSAALLRRPPRFPRCRSYAVDFLFGRTAGNLIRSLRRR
jgi:glycosyltransferase involved in cell wall biosynthesis